MREAKQREDQEMQARPLTRPLQSESWTRSKGNSQEGNTFEGIIFDGSRPTRPREKKTKQLQKKAKPIKSGPAFQLDDGWPESEKDVC